MVTVKENRTIPGGVIHMEPVLIVPSTFRSAQPAQQQTLNGAEFNLSGLQCPHLQIELVVLKWF